MTSACVPTLLVRVADLSREDDSTVLAKLLKQGGFPAAAYDLPVLLQLEKHYGLLVAEVDGAIRGVILLHRFWLLSGVGHACFTVCVPTSEDALSSGDAKVKREAREQEGRIRGALEEAAARWAQEHGCVTLSDVSNVLVTCGTRPTHGAFTAVSTPTIFFPELREEVPDSHVALEAAAE